MEKIREIKTLKGTTTHQQVTHNKNKQRQERTFALTKVINYIFWLQESQIDLLPVSWSVITVIMLESNIIRKA